MATDGLWDCLSDEEAVEVVVASMNESDSEQLAARTLVEYALQKTANSR